MPSQSRIEANSWIKEQAKLITGKVLSIGSMEDSDHMGLLYRNYFENAESYTTSDIKGNVDMIVDVQKMSDVKDKSYQCLFVSGVLEHIPDFQSAMNEIYRVLSEKGVLILGMPFRQAIHSAPEDYWRFTKYGTQELLKARFRIDESIELDKEIGSDFPAAYIVKATKL